MNTAPEYTTDPITLGKTIEFERSIIKWLYDQNIEDYSFEFDTVDWEDYIYIHFKHQKDSVLFALKFG